MWAWKLERNETLHITCPTWQVIAACAIWSHRRRQSSWMWRMLGQKVRSTRHNAIRHDGQLVTPFYGVTSWPCDELTGSRLSTLMNAGMCNTGTAFSPGPYKPRTSRTGQCVNHALVILAAPALIYSTQQVLVMWIIVAHFHLCSVLGWSH